MNYLQWFIQETEMVLLLILQQYVNKDKVGQEK